ncbi:hypothetical protein Z042_14020 [Chania multitudinisentens RB-25]|uniref:HTH luxR-type domain-containing protein n=1 Tax=Chania multitudinisentens RB-25 TaxID=1441930 RepID=W0LK54_9GAMM|nr:LuxR C-terminal-related transcriptional regulator [Chania multitudinisentens]AHG22804.1 hypothetical protein Z042_14020 [Chania multitudinisentens RB-25]
MNADLTEKQGVILHPCHFARLGMRHLLPSNYQVFETADLNACQERRLVQGAPDLMIIALRGERYSMLSALELIEMLCHNNTHCQILVMLNISRLPGVRDYLMRYGERVRVIDPSSTLPRLTWQLERVIDRPVNPLQSVRTPLLPILSKRERQVLDALLLGNSVQRISRRFSLNIKTVSHYKRSALGKLGMKTMQPLLVWSTALPAYHFRHRDDILPEG